MKRRKDGRYGVNVYLGTVDGIKKYRYVYGRTQQEVKAKADTIRAKKRAGVDVVNKHALNYYADLWLSYKLGNVTDRHYASLECIVNDLDPLLAENVEDIRPNDLRALLTQYARTNPHTGKPTSQKTLNDIRHAMEQILDLAVEDRLIESNPASLVKSPRGRPSKERRPLTAEQIQWIRDTPDPCQTAAMIMLYCGLRRGEVSALTPLDVDFKAGTIRVCKTVEYSGKTATVVNRTKTKAGMRTVPMPYVLSAYLQTVPMTHRYIAFDSDLPKSSYYWQHIWQSYMEELDVKYGDRVPAIKSKFAPYKGGGMIIQTFTPHQLRHTYASMLYAAGVDVLTAKELLGHDDVSTTLGIYTHLDDETKSKNIDKYNQYLDKTAEN